MIAALMMYGAAIATLLALAAFMAERALAAIGFARRGVWIVAIAGSLLVPALMVALSGQAVEQPSSPMPLLSDEVHARNATTETAAGTSALQVMPVATVATRKLWLPQWNTLLTAGWLFASLILAGLYAAAYLHTSRRLSSLRRASVAGESVVLSDDLGPAVFGVLSPTIIVPRWLKEASDSLQSLVLEHERQHVLGRDQLLLAFAMIAVVIAPWNPALWWQLRRLRFAIEVDCDARVLCNGADALAYGEALLHVGRRYLRAPAGAIALIEPTSHLERRIRIMMRDRGRHALVIAAACVGACASLVAVAAQIDPPRLDSTDLRLPPSRGNMHERVGSVVRETYPELFEPARNQPAAVTILLNNDLSVDWSEQTLLPIGSSQQDIAAREQAKDILLKRLHPDEGRFVGELVLPGGIESPPIFVTYAIHLFHESRSPAAVERALKRQYPELYDDLSDSRVLLIVLMNADGTIDRAVQRAKAPGESLIGEENWRKAFRALQSEPLDAGVMAMIGSRATSPFRPTVLYAFRKSGDPTLDGDAMRPVDRSAMLATQRALIERHFPDIADGSTNPHALLWVLLDRSGDVVATGREATSPDPLMATLEPQYPGAATARRVTTQLTALFGREMRDVEGQPILATFAWLDDESAKRKRSAVTAQSIAVESTLYRNGELFSTAPLTLTIGQRQIQTYGSLRMDVTALDASKDLVDLGIVLRVPVANQDIEFAERWEIISSPMIRTRMGEAAVIEQGMRYPDKAGSVVWRIELKPRQTG